jgi:hypothetical protein
LGADVIKDLEVTGTDVGTVATPNPYWALCVVESHDSFGGSNGQLILFDLEDNCDKIQDEFILADFNYGQVDNIAPYELCINGDGDGVFSDAAGTWTWNTGDLTSPISVVDPSCNINPDTCTACGCVFDDTGSEISTLEANKILAELRDVNGFVRLHDLYCALSANSMFDQADVDAWAQAQYATGECYLPGDSASFIDLLVDNGFYTAFDPTD